MPGSSLCVKYVKCVPFHPKKTKPQRQTFYISGRSRYVYIYIYPIPSMYGMFNYIYHKNQPNVGEYSIHELYMDAMGMT